LEALKITNWIGIIVYHSLFKKDFEIHNLKSVDLRKSPYYINLQNFLKMGIGMRFTTARLDTYTYTSSKKIRPI